MTLNQPLNPNSSSRPARKSGKRPLFSGKRSAEPEGKAAAIADPIHSKTDRRQPQSPQPQRSGRGSDRRPSLGTRLLLSWQLWILLAMGCVGTTGSLAVLSLLRLPQAWECPRVFWPLASASLRVYCAQAAADQHTHRGLLDAITLVEPLPENHPLRPMVDRNLRRWSLELMDVTEQLFQDGNLSDALATADKIPYKYLPCNDTECPKEVMERRKKRWKKVWEQAEKIFQDAEKSLINQKWTEASEIAAELLSIENRYWRTTKYEELSSQIQEVRGTNSVLAKARQLAEKGDVENILQAIKLVSTIPASSRLYPVAKGSLSRFGRQLMDLAEQALDSQDLSEALSIVDQIPEQANLKKEIKDFKLLARAQARTWSGYIPDLQAAIADVKLISIDRPLYSKAQQLIVRWQTEIEDITRLDKAQKLASEGSIPSLITAISEVSLIPKTNPRWDEAQRLINQWSSTIQTQEDSPFLDRAERLSQGASIEAYQAAIAEASRIGKGRALYDQAQGRISDWRDKLEWLQDQPFLAQARALAAAGNLQGAIATAQQIGSGRRLYGEAQDAIGGWQSQVDSQGSLAKARQYAQDRDNPDALLQAIKTADRVPTSSSLRYDADLDIETWSNRILQIAISRADSDLYSAIDIAQLIPSWTGAYGAAQSRISGWQELLQPVIPPEPVYEAPIPAPPPAPVEEEPAPVLEPLLDEAPATNP